MGMRTSFSAPEAGFAAAAAAAAVASVGILRPVVEDWEKRSVEERDRLGLDRRDDSRRREMGSSEVRVRERKRVEKCGIPVAGCVLSGEGGGGVPGQVARRICRRSSRSSVSRAGFVSLRPAQETRRMLRSTLGTMPARFSFAKVWV